MMTPIKSISIPQACNQSWQQMQLAEHGRYCGHCCKTVTDFTTMTNDEILAFLATERKVCGRFGSEQLSRLNYLLQHDQRSLFSLKKFSLAAAMLAIAPFITTQAQIPVKTEQTPFRQKEKAAIADTACKTISGIVVAADDKLPVPGVLINIKGSTTGTLTGADGKFKIDVPAGHDTLVFRFIGFETQEVKADKFLSGPINIMLKTNDTVELKMTWTGGIIATRSIFYRMWYFIKRPIVAIFRRRDY